MDRSVLRKSIAVVTLVALASCGGGGATGAGPMPPSGSLRNAQQSILARIVGVGDSLTAGYQSDGFLGATDFKNPLKGTKFVPPGQQNGWWSLLVEQSSSNIDAEIATMFDPAKSPLPLIAGPGLDNQVVLTNNLAVPFNQFKGTDPCKFDNGFNQSGFGLRSSARVRINPNSTTIRNFGIPGLTQHEANTIHLPQTDTCSPLPGIPGLLSDVVSEESGTFWPVLRNFSSLGIHLTEVNAAASVHPTLATVWLGANDVLKYMGSGGRFLGGNRTVGQVESDLHRTISTLQGSGARVVMANLPNILQTGYFQRVTVPTDPERECKNQSYAFCLMQLGSIGSFVTFIAKKYGLETPGGCTPTSLSKPCGYLTLPGVVLTLNYFEEFGQLPNLDCAQPAPDCKPVKGSGLGANYITPAFAAKVQALNDIINQGIDGAATANRVPLVNIYAIYRGLVSGSPTNPYYHLVASINPGVCCTIGYVHPIDASSSIVTGGILSFDGIHPSNTGYALLAYVFIDTINKAYGTHIPQIDITSVYNGSRCKTYCYPDPYAPH
jgi:lysophospholipase L1-like esterase